MNVSEAVAARRTIRAYLDRPVEEAVMRRILDKSQMAPSSLNFQPWRAVVLGGEPLAALGEAIRAAQPDDPADFPLYDPATPQRYLDRREALMVERMAAIGVARDDMVGRAAFQRRNYDFFGAPAVLFAFVPRALSPNNWASAGLWLQTVMLLAVEEGLGTCPQESLSSYASLVHAACGVDRADHFLWCGLAIGWPDMAAPINCYPRPRAPLDEVAQFKGLS